MADILICLVLIAIVTSIVHSLIKNKKQGKSLCSGACTGNRFLSGNQKQVQKKPLRKAAQRLFSLSKNASSRYARAGVLVVSKKK